MPWVGLDDRFPSDQKTRLLSHQAFRLYVLLLCYAAENLADGHTPAEEPRLAADVKSHRKSASEPVARGLRTVNARGGRDIHDYLEYHPGAERNNKTARQKRWRNRKKENRLHPPRLVPNPRV